MSAVLEAVGILPAGRFVVSYSYDGFANSIDMLDAFHPQTILAHGMNGGDLSVRTARRCGCASSGSWATRA